LQRSDCRGENQNLHRKIRRFSRHCFHFCNL